MTHKMWIGIGVVVAVVVAFVLLRRRAATTSAIVQGADAASGANRSGGGTLLGMAGNPSLLGRALVSADKFTQIVQANLTRAEGAPGSAGAVPVGTPSRLELASSYARKSFS